ncbi:MAG: lytic murein transglycosylase [Methylocystis sp.]|nr:lytic murein transglycosylase [Methylocystis sp.]
MMANHLFVALAALLLTAAPARAEWSSCVSGLRAAAAGAGVSQQTIASATDGLTPNDAVSFMDKQPEFATPIWDYIAGLVDEDRVEEGRAMLRQHARALHAAESRYGVDAPTIVAVWGVEILDHGDIAPEEFYGSWAGAFGHTQFMPSTFLGMAVDLDGDGRRNIASSAADSLGSTANYLRKSGWRAGMPWGFEVRLPDGYSGPSGRTHRQSMGFWQSRGVTRLDGGGGLGEGSAALLLPAGRNGPAFLVTRNFDAVYAYNAAESYALAICVLSDLLRGRPGIQTPWPTDDPGLSRAERRELQALLTRNGYDVGDSDGVIGTKTKEAIADFQSRAGLQRNGRASLKVLNALRGR